MHHPLFHRNDPDLVQWRQAVSNNRLLTCQSLRDATFVAPRRPPQMKHQGPASITPSEQRNTKAVDGGLRSMPTVKSAVDEISPRPLPSLSPSPNTSKMTPDVLPAVTPFNERDYSPIPPTKSVSSCVNLKGGLKELSVLNPRVEVIRHPTAVYMMTHQVSSAYDIPSLYNDVEPLPLFSTEQRVEASTEPARTVIYSTDELPGLFNQMYSNRSGIQRLYYDLEPLPLSSTEQRVAASTEPARTAIDNSAAERPRPFNQMYSNRSGIAVSPMATTGLGHTPRRQAFFPTAPSDATTEHSQEWLLQLYQTPRKRPYPENDDPSRLFTGDSSAFTPLLSATSFHSNMFSPDVPSLAAMWIEPRHLEDCLTNETE